MDQEIVREGKCKSSGKEKFSSRQGRLVTENFISLDENVDRKLYVICVKSDNYDEMAEPCSKRPNGTAKMQFS